MRMGLIFMNIVPMKVAAKRKRLMKNCQGLTSGVEKLSPLQSIRVAAASKPTTAGCRPLKTDFTTGVSIYFMNILLIRIISINDGRTNAKVAMKLPKADIYILYPALCTATYPQYVAVLIPMGPGVIWLIATILVNSAVESQ